MGASTAHITILVDNKASEGLAAEHGLSLWIEADGKRVLFDTGQSAAFAANALALGVKLATADIVVLSHGHYDHTGGLPQVFGARSPAVGGQQPAAFIGAPQLYCHPGVTRPRYAVREGKATSIGMPVASLGALEQLPASQVRWVREPVWLSPNVGLTGPLPRLTPYEDSGGPFYLDAHGKQPDSIEDDLALWILTAKGLILCLGCCHAGLVNTLRHVRTVTTGTRPTNGWSEARQIRAVIGGLHLVNATRERLEGTIAELKPLKPELVVPCHCTGEAAVAQLKTALGDIVQEGASGLTFHF